LRFARDITLHADRTTREQVEELRRLGLADPLVLDLIAACAMVNAGNRLHRALAPDLLRAAAAAATPVFAPGPAAAPAS
jgi:alkylhydroperoxidase family enzyme